jgi:DNA-binding NarL/FixJ family response regulator
VVTALAATCEVNKNAGHHARTLAASRELRVTAGASYLSQEIMALQLLDRYDEAQTMLDAAQLDAQNHVEAVLPSLVLARMWQDFWLCRWDGAEQAAAQLATIGRELGSHVHALEGMSILSVSALQRGDLALARARFDAMLGYQGIDEEFREPRMILIRSWIRSGEGDAADAARSLRPLLATALESRAHWPWWPGWMRTVVNVGLRVHDRGLMDDALAVAEQGALRNPGVVTFEGLALQLRGLVHDDVDLLHRAAALLRTGPREILAATSEKDLGHALLARGERAEGLLRLRTALDTYSRLEMPLAADGVRRTLARHEGSEAAGATGPGDWSRLTESERRVARLIGLGYTNRQAAAELHLSPNTIGSHVRSAYSKLGIRSRVQLAHVLREVAEPPGRPGAEVLT